MISRDKSQRLVIRLLVTSIVLLTISFIWKEWEALSLKQKINSEKVADFFSAVGVLVTATTLFLLYRQIQEQIEDRKAASRPDLYPENQFFALSRRDSLPQLSREGKTDPLNGMISIHNIGLASAKEIALNWFFQKEVLSSMIESPILPIYAKRETEFKYSFIPQNTSISLPLPIMYVASLAYYKSGWAEMIWEELFLELSYKDIHGHTCPVKIFKVNVIVGQLYTRFDFELVENCQLSNQSTMRSPFSINREQS